MRQWPFSAGDQALLHDVLGSGVEAAGTSTRASRASVLRLNPGLWALAAWATAAAAATTW